MSCLTFFFFYFKVLRTYLLCNGLIEVILLFICLFLSKREILLDMHVKKVIKCKTENGLEGAKFVGMSAGRLLP